MLTESSHLDPHQTLAALKRHPGAAPLFRRGAPAPDPAALFRAFRDVLLASQAARRFMDAHGITWKWWEALRADPPEDMNHLVAAMIDTIKAFARAVGRVQRGALSAAARKELADWVNSNRSFSVSPSLVRELAATPGIRPDRPVLLYRGLLFRRWQFDDETHPRSALRFLAAARGGQRGLTVNGDRASSWTTDPEVAERFARYGAASSSFGAMFQSLHRARQNHAIDGEMGIVIATLARPEDVLVDLGRVDLGHHQQHGDEAEMILKPGARTVKIVRLWNQAGEVDLDHPAADPSARLVAAIKRLRLDTTPAPTFADDLLDPKAVALAYGARDDLLRRYDFTRERLRSVLDGVDPRGLDPVQGDLKRLAALDLRMPALERYKTARVDRAVGGLLRDSDANRALARALGLARAQAYHLMTDAKQETLFGALFAKVLKAAGKERPATWGETVAAVRKTMGAVARTRAIAVLLNDMLFLARNLADTVPEEDLAEAKKAFLDEDVVVRYEPRFPLKYVPGMEDRAAWFLAKLHRSLDGDPACCADLHAKLMGHDDRPVLLHVDPSGECRAVLDGNHRIGAALARGESTIPAFVGRGHALDEKAPPGVKAERFIRKAKKDFQKRYGKDWEARLYGTAWKLFGEGRVKDS